MDYPVTPKADGRRVLGHSVTRLEDLPLVTGRGRYAGDINFPHQLHMRIVRSPRGAWPDHIGRYVSGARAAGRLRGVDQCRRLGPLADRLPRRHMAPISPW